MLPSIVVFLGAGIGGVLRHLINSLFFHFFNTEFPLATLAINVLGSCLMGLFIGWFAYRATGVDQSVRLFLTTGLLGGFTTFSAFSLESLLLIERGLWGQALIYVGASIILSLTFTCVGIWVFR